MKSFHEHILKSSSEFDQTKFKNKFSVKNNQQNNRIVQQNRAEKFFAKLDLFFYSNQKIKRILIKCRKIFREESKFITFEEFFDEFSDEKLKKRK